LNEIKVTTKVFYKREGRQSSGRCNKTSGSGVERIKGYDKEADRKRTGCKACQECVVVCLGELKDPDHLAINLKEQIVLFG
jgi:hypothetical protein